MPDIFDFPSGNDFGSESEPEDLDPPAAQGERKRKRGPRNEHTGWGSKTENKPAWAAGGQHLMKF